MITHTHTHTHIAYKKYLDLIYSACKVAGIVFEPVFEVKMLGEVCEFKRGTTINKKSTSKGNIPVVGGGQTPAYYHSEYNRSGKTISVAGSGAYAGYIGYWNEPIFLSDAFSVHPNEALNIDYLYYFLKNNQHKIYELKQGSGVPHVYSNDLGKLSILLPPLPIQNQVVMILDKLNSVVDEVGGLLPLEIKQRQQQYEYYRDKLLSFDF